jgi:hypothetical protein
VINRAVRYTLDIQRSENALARDSELSCRKTKHPSLTISTRKEIRHQRKDDVIYQRYINCEENVMAVDGHSVESFI